MNLTTIGVTLRWFLLVLLSVGAAWSLAQGGQLAIAGSVLAGIAICGFYVQRGKATWYILGTVALLWGLWLGITNSDGGPLEGTLGFCGSVFEPTRGPIDEDAPPGLVGQCRAVEDERKPFIVVLAGIGTYALVRACRSRVVKQEVISAPQDSVKA